MGANDLIAKGDRAHGAPLQRARLLRRGRESRHATTRSSLPRLLRDRLHLDPQRHCHAEAVILASRHAELVALDRRQRIGATHLALEHRVRHALEAVDLQSHRTRHSVQGQFARHARRLAVDEILQPAAVGRLRVLRHVEQFRSARVLVERIVAKIDAGHVDGDLHRAGAGLLVECDRAAAVVELATPDRQPGHVVGLEAGIGVLGIDVVVDRGRGGNAVGRQQRDKRERPEGKAIPDFHRRRHSSTIGLKPPKNMRLPSNGMSLGPRFARRGSAMTFLLIRSRCARDL